VGLVPGTRLGPYEVLSPLGSGAMGEVYRARDVRLGRDVAIKVLPEETAKIPDRLPRFEREARAVAALNHPNILALHDIGQDAGIVYAVMELLEGDTLRARLEAAGSLSPLKATNYASQIARGLAAAHERGIVHRDLKPANLFITNDGRLKILDFGLAHRYAEAATDADSQVAQLATEPGTIIGTPLYMSPEQLLGETATTRSDLFAFGLIVYEMLTGRHPFKRDTGANTVKAILREDPTPLGRALPDLPAGLAGVLESCLDKDASNRPASARDLALFLDAAGSGSNESVAGRRIAPADVRRLRARVVGISCGLLILLSVTTWAFVRTMADRTVSAVIDADLARATRLVTRVQGERLTGLALTARLVASFPELRALFATDAATIRDYLLSYQQRNKDAPMLVALAPDGSVIARTDDIPVSDGNEEWAATLIERGGEPMIVEMRNVPFHAAAAVADAGGNVFGYVIGAAMIDDAFASSIRDVTQDEVVLLSDRGVVASTLRAGQTPWSSRDQWRRAGVGADRELELAIGGQPFAAREVVLSDRPGISAIVLKSRDEVIAPFRRIQNGVLLIGLLCAAIAAAGSLWIAKTLASTWTPKSP
jgi:Protein kinase domain